MLATRNIQYHYQKERPMLFPDLVCEAGKSLLLLGPSGCGKTTLLHLIGGLLTPNQGEIQINGIKTSQLAQKKLDHFRGKNIGVIFQKNHFVAALNVEENLLLAQKLVGTSPSKEKVKLILATLQLDGKSKALPYQLSQGEQQRVAIARALINQPKLILADEPTSALDDRNCEEVITLLANQAQEQQAALIIVTHDNRLKTRFSDCVTL